MIKFIKDGAEKHINNNSDLVSILLANGWKKEPEKEKQAVKTKVKDAK